MTDQAGKELIETGAKHPMVVGGSVFLDVALFEHAQRVAQMLATSTMIGEHFQDNIGNILIALNLAHRWKADPFMVMQNVYIVHGKPGLEGKLVIALVNQCGKFTTIQYDFTRDNNGKTTACKAFATDKATGNVLEQIVTWEMVEAEGWHKPKKGTPSKWVTIPDLMFQYRSATWFARVYCPEVLLGMQTTEEIFDFTDMHKGAGGTYSAEPSTASDLTAAIKKKEVIDKLEKGDQSNVPDKPTKVPMPENVEQKDKKSSTEEKTADTASEKEAAMPKPDKVEGKKGKKKEKPETQLSPEAEELKAVNVEIKKYPPQRVEEAKASLELPDNRVHSLDESNLLLAECKKMTTGGEGDLS